MTTIKKKIFLSFCLLIYLGSAIGQDIHFSQIFETPLVRNPALAGIFTGDIRLQSVYRSQWNTVTDAYHTGSFSGEYKIPVGFSDDFITLGAQVLYDKAGTVALTSTHVLPAINYHKSLSNDRNMYLSAAFMGGVVQRKIDASKITTNSQYINGIFVPTAPTGENLSRTAYSYFDGIVGLSLNTQLNDNPDNNLYIGGAYHHFLKPKQASFFANSDIELKPKIVGSFGIRTSVNEASYITLQGDYSMQGSYSELIAGALYSWKLDDFDDPLYIFHVGTYFRWQDAIIPAIKIERKPVSFAFSYDANISPLKAASRGRGGFEVSISYQKFVERANRQNDPSMRCPKF